MDAGQDPILHERLAATARDVLAYLTATEAGLFDVADSIVTRHLHGKDKGVAFTALLGLETTYLIRRLEAAQGLPQGSVLQERGRTCAAL